MATIAAIRRETGNAWALFVTLWTTGVAYAVASCFYQIATWQENTLFSLSWVGGTFMVLFLTLVALRMWAGRGRKPELAIG